MNDRETMVHAIVKGRVQGVGFRATTQYHANRLGVLGTVKNLSDGTVEIYAQASHSQIQALFLSLKEETGMEDIENIDQSPVTFQKEFSSFEIIF